MVITKIQAATEVKIITRLAAYIRVSSDSEDRRTVEKTIKYIGCAEIMMKIKTNAR